MGIIDVERFVAESCSRYAICSDYLGYAETRRDLLWLLHEARKSRIPRRGIFRSESGVECTFHIHGIGYTFADAKSGKTWRFDVERRNGVQNLRFSTWEFATFLKGEALEIDESELDTELRNLAGDTNGLRHIAEGRHSYFCFAISQNSPE